MNIAIFSPSKDAYSETFIQNHKKFLDGNIFYYYDGYVPTALEGVGKLYPSIIDEIVYILRRAIGRKIEYRLIESKTLIRSIKTNKIDLVYAEYGMTGAEVIGICKEANIPLIVNFHGADASITSITTAYKEKYIDLFNFADSVIVVSKTMRAKLLSLGCPHNKVCLITSGPSAIFFDVVPQYSEDSFIAIGRFVDKKAPYYTILAFNKVVDKYPHAILYMVGDGPLIDVCINLVSKLNLSDNVIFLGICSHETIRTYYQKVKAFIQHSITPSSGDMEGTPVAILEASASALPVIATRHAGIPDVIIEKETGFLVDEHDIDGMAKYMIQIIEDKELAKKMGEAGRENIKENFSLKKHINLINSEIINVLNSIKNGKK